MSVEIATVVLLDMEASSAISFSKLVCHSMAFFSWEGMVVDEAITEETKLGLAEEIEDNFSRPLIPNSSYIDL